MSKAKYETKISPRGVFVYPRLTKPDFEFKDCGEYSVKLRVSADDAAKLVEEIDAALEANHKAECTKQGKKVKRVDPPYTVDEESGDILFTFRKNATRKDDKGEVKETPVRIKSNNVVDGKLEDFPADVDIWGGTVGRIAFQIFPYFFAAKGAGIRMNMVEVKVLKLVTGSAGDCFGDEDSDYVADDDDEADSCGDSDCDSFEADADGDVSGADF